jgi:hypothetical protein
MTHKPRHARWAISGTGRPVRQPLALRSPEPRPVMSIEPLCKSTQTAAPIFERICRDGAHPSECVRHRQSTSATSYCSAERRSIAARRREDNRGDAGRSSDPCSLSRRQRMRCCVKHPASAIVGSMSSTGFGSHDITFFRCVASAV